MPLNVWAPLLKSLRREVSVKTFSSAVEQWNLPLDLRKQRQQCGRYLRREYIPLYMTCGVIFMSTSLGLLTAGRELLYAPNVLVNKKKRREIPEVEEPDYVLRNAQEFMNKSFFRKLGKVSGRYHDIMRTKSISTSAEHNTTDTHK